MASRWRNFDIFLHEKKDMNVYFQIMLENKNSNLPKYVEFPLDFDPHYLITKLKIFNSEKGNV